MNIPSAILQMCTGGHTTSAISSLLGLSQDQTKRATGAAVPTLLAGFTGLASTPQGAEQLAGAVGRQDTGLVDNISGALSSQGAGIAEQGSGILSSLLGGGITSKLGGVLSQFTGVGQAKTGQLMGLLVPMILGFLGKQQKTMGLNAGGLASLLTGQKDNLRAAMPPGLDKMLSSALPGAGQLFGGDRPNVSRPDLEPALAEQSGSRENHRAHWSSPDPVEAGAQHSSKRWVLPVMLALAALAGFLLWSKRDRAHREAAVPPAASVGAASAPAETATGQGSSVVSVASQLITQATTKLAGIRDKASAEAAAPGLKQISNRLSALAPMWNQLPDSAKSTARNTLQPQISKLNEAAQPILNLPGVGETIQPQVDELMTNLKTFTSQ
jgi:hypothetical protein